MPTRSKTRKKPTESKGLYRVMEDDKHNSPIIHVFRNRKHFLDHALDQDADFGVHDYIEDGEFTDDNDVTWSHYTGLHEIDHTSEPMPQFHDQTRYIKD